MTLLDISATNHPLNSCFPALVVGELGFCESRSGGGQPGWIKKLARGLGGWLVDVTRCVSASD